MPSINDPRKGYNAATGRVEEYSCRPRPQTSNADEWALWLEQHADYGIEFKAVQIAEALDSMHRGATNAARSSAAQAASSMLAALEEISAAHLPDQPTASYVDERTYALQHIAYLRKTARAAVALAHAAGIKSE